MSAFLLMSVPLFYLAISNMMNDVRGKIDDSYKPLTYGIICFIPVIIVYNIIRLLFISQKFTIEGIFLYHFLHDYFFQFFFASFFYFIVFGFKDMYQERRGLNRAFAFLCGFYAFWSINDAIINFGNYNMNNILLVPVLRLCTISLFCLLLNAFQNGKFFVKAISIMLWLILPILTSAASLFWRLSYTLEMIAVLIGLLGLSLFLLFRETKSQPTTPR